MEQLRRRMLDRVRSHSAGRFGEGGNALVDFGQFGTYQPFSSTVAVSAGGWLIGGFMQRGDSVPPGGQNIIYLHPSMPQTFDATTTSDPTQANTQANFIPMGSTSGGWQQWMAWGKVNSTGNALVQERLTVNASTGATATYAFPWLIYIPPGTISDSEVVRLIRDVLRNVPTNMPAGGGIYALLAHQKLYFGNDTNLYRGGTTTLKTDATFSTPKLTGMTDSGVVTNLNADMVDGKHASAFAQAGFSSVSYSATPTFDANAASTFKITLAGNVTASTLSNAVSGQQLKFIVCQDGTGGRSFAWPANVRGGVAVGQSANKCSAQSFVFDGSTAYATASGVIEQ